MKLSERIRTLRGGRSQSSIAASVGMEQALWSQLESGVADNPTLATLQDVARACGIDVAALMTGVDAMPDRRSAQRRRKLVRI